jgi:hypothetical protein
MVLRSNFSSSRLVRMLGRWEPAPAEAPRQDIAERLGQWLSVHDSIALDGAHRRIRERASGRPAAARGLQCAAVPDEVQLVRAGLVEAILAKEAPASSSRRGRSALPRPAVSQAEAEVDAEAAFAPHRKRYLELQRQMALQVEGLRGRLRQTLTAATPQLARLAALDAVMAQLLGDRQQTLLASLPVQLERRFAQLRASGAAGAEVVTREMQHLLLAELDVRLEPVVGLMEACVGAGCGVGFGGLGTCP